MVNFLKIIFVIFLCASIIVGARFLLNYSAFFQTEKPFDPNSVKHPEYIFKAFNKEKGLELNLPDLSIYIPTNLKFNLPETQSGVVEIQNLTHGIRDLRVQAGTFGEKQQRLDALSIVIKRGVYDLEMLTAQVNDGTLLEQTGDNTFILHVPLSIRMAGGLTTQKGETLYLNENTGALISNFGALHIMGATILGWDVENDKAADDRPPEDFRPYIITWCGAETNVVEARLAYLGYGANRAQGLTYTSCDSTLYADDYKDFPAATGWVIDSHFSDFYQGFTAIQADGVAVLRNKYEGHTLNGMGLHAASQNMIIAFNTIRGTKLKHGILVEEHSTNNLLAYNTVTQNNENGLVFFESPNNTSYKNKLTKNNKVGLRVRDSLDIHSHDDVLNYNNHGGVYLSGRLSSLTMHSPELIGNKGTNFKIEGARYFEIVTPTLYKSPSYFFTGDLQQVSQEDIMRALQAYDGFSITGMPQ